MLFCFLCVKVVHHFLYDPESKLAVGKDAAAASFPFPGVFLWENFISEEEESELISTMDQDVWNESQSGRRKQVMPFSFASVNFFPGSSFKRTERVREQGLGPNNQTTH